MTTSLPVVYSNGTRISKEALADMSMLKTTGCGCKMPRVKPNGDGFVICKDCGTTTQTLDHMVEELKNDAGPDHH